jgi:benzoyl-CoA reductase/2-hydroxyglutaryl-CoA dehydratase subunit BcrC/BadD/HgdB
MRERKGCVTEQSSSASNTRVSSTRGSASVKRLRTASVATAYQRTWFAGLRERVLSGEPLAMVNADVPQEIFRTMDIPYVVNQWWASVCSAKQMSSYYLGLLNERGYRQDLCRYCSLSLASAFDPEPEKGPWGGLPRPTFAVSRQTCSSQEKIFELWSRQFGVPFYSLETTVPQKIPGNWWEKASEHWEELFEAHRLDLMVEDFQYLIRFLERSTGKVFSENKFQQVMDLVNQQAEYNRKTRDLIMHTLPAPVSITDTVQTVMVPQWQRGTQWAVDIARALYEEVSDLVEHGIAVCPNERVRLMWVGRGLWFNLGFYQHFEQRYGAVFVWSIYLAIAADGYARYGGDPLRALASRFAGMEDMLHMPPWNSDWYVHEAKSHQIDGVVHLVSQSCTMGAGGSYFIQKALEDAGIPVLQLHADPVDARAWNEESMTEALEQFLQERLGVKPL